MAAETIIVTEYDNTTDVTFTQQSKSGAVSEWIDAAGSLAVPQSASFRHEIKPLGSKGADRHSVTFRRAKVGSDGVLGLASATLSLVVPRTGDISDTDMQDLIRFIMCYFGASGNTNIANFLDGITPSGDKHIDGFTL